MEALAWIPCNPWSLFLFQYNHADQGLACLESNTSVLYPAACYKAGGAFACIRSALSLQVSLWPHEPHCNTSSIVADMSCYGVNAG